MRGWLLMVAGFAAFGAAQPQPARTVVAHVSVVDVANGNVLPDWDVEIEGARITAVRAASSSHPPGVRVIDGRGRHLLPGLWDSHVHLSKLGAGSLALLLAHGVTSVRDMGSDIDEVKAWRADIIAGQRPGPRIRTSGPILESRSNVERMLREQTVEPVARLRVPVGSPEEAKAAVARLAAAGVDFLKIRTVANPETLTAIVEAARAHRLMLCGHPVAAPDGLAAAHFGSVEHVLAIPPLDALTPAQRRATFERLRDAGVRLGATDVNLDDSVLLGYDEASRRLAADPLKRFVSPYLARDWAEQVAENQGAEADAQIASYRALLPSLYRDLREMHAAGVPFLAGSDAAVVFMHAGPSLHGELASLVRHVGFSPVEALRAATMEPARLFGLERELGLVRAGFIADLVLIDGDPLADITRTRAIVGVMTNGVYYDKSGIDALLERAARDAR